MSTENKVTKVRSVYKEPDREFRIFTLKATELVWLFFGILEALIALRILLKLIGANPASPIAAFIYAVTDLFLFPFAGLIGAPAAGGMVLELSSFLAMLIYALIGWAIARLIWVLFYRPRGGEFEEVTQTVRSEDHTHHP